MSIEFVEPTRESRRNLSLLIVLALAIGAATKFWWLPAFFAHINSLPACEQIRWLRGGIIGASATPVLFVLWSIPHAIRLLKANQSPLPGTWVFQRTPIKRGRPVRIRAIGLLLASAFTLTIPVAGVFALQSMPFAAHLKGKGCT